MAKFNFDLERGARRSRRNGGKVVRIVLLFCLLFVTDFAPVRDMLSCLLGRFVYESVHFGARLHNLYR